MRCCLASAARTLSLIFLALVFSQTLLLVSAADSSASDSTDVSDPNGNGDGSAGIPPTITSSSVSSSSSSSSATSPTATSSSTATTSPVTKTSTSTSHSATEKASSSTTSSTSKSTSSSPGPNSNANINSNTSQSSSSSPSSSSSSSSSSSTSSTETAPDSSSSSTSSTSTATSATSSSATTGVTLQPNTGTPLNPNTITANAAEPASTDYTWLTSSSSADSGTETASSGSVSASSNGFFDNKGAVGATFTIVGLVGLGAVIAGVIYAKRRAARIQDEEDMTYFEKYTGNNENSQRGDNSVSDMDFNGGAEILTVHDEPLAIHAAPDAYPDRAMHYGLPSMEEYSQPQPMGGVPYVDYPPNMGYHGHQYTGYEGAYGATQSAPNQTPAADGYYEASRHSPNSATHPHPYANPSNSPRTSGALPVQQYTQPPDIVVHGEAS